MFIRPSHYLLLFKNSKKSVCYEDFNRRERRPRCLPCGHTFCTQCISTDLTKAKKVCPNCRKDYKALRVCINYALEYIIAETTVVSSRNTDASTQTQSAIVDVKAEDFLEASSVFRQMVRRNRVYAVQDKNEIKTYS